MWVCWCDPGAWLDGVLGFSFAVVKVPERTIQGGEDLLRSTDPQCQSMAVWFLQLGQNIMKIGTRGMRDPFTLW